MSGYVVPVPQWREHSVEGFEVATVAVPLNHADPAGRTIDMEVIRHPAADPGRRAGALFFVPGGPAFPGVTLLPSHYPFLPAQVRDRFDIVSFDPRGAGASTPVRGFASTDEMMGLFADLPMPFPADDAQGQIWIERFTEFGRLVRDRNADLLPHISTSDIARDMALLARALGEESINFYGVSYGSLLGVVFANMFPGQVRAMVLDGAIDPVNWYGLDGDRSLCTPLRVGFDLAAARGVDRFLDLAAAGSPFSAGDGAATRAKFATLLERLQARPVELSTPQGPVTVTYGTVIAQQWVVMYQTAYWAEQAARLQVLWLATEAAGDGPHETSFDFANRPEGADVPPLYASPPEQSLALLGSDAPAPEDPQSWIVQAKIAQERAGGMGLMVAWPAVATAAWPDATGRYQGPWDRTTAGPVLLIGVTGDPGTPFEATARLAATMPGARLLTIEGEGHTAHYNPEPQVQDLIADYLIDGTPPADGVVLRQTRAPFPG
jgi:pimeloyl-ACP methyl ester carboxylesterase